uniref:Post-GPI attachment to proteins factor 3 n=1 Tax=Brassica oleracea var. oleracea TaxID=109376 RepID=A0A0D3CRT8_BRAOL
CSKDESDYGWYTTKIKINNSDLKNEEDKPAVRVASLGHAFHVWLNGEYLGNKHGSHDEKSRWSLSGACFYCFLCAKPSDAFPWVALHLQDVDITKTLDYLTAIAILGFSLIVSILRTFDVRVEAARVMVSPPVLAFVTSHIISMFTGWNMIVCVAMGVAQIFLWARWAAVSRHPSNWKLWVVVIASCLAMVLEIYDFPLRMKAHSIWHLATVPLTVLWWSFIRDNVEFRTSSLLKKSKT